MCGIFGIVRYDDKASKVLDQKYLLQRLGFHSESRGTHAGGIAFKNRLGDIEVVKSPGAISKNGTFDNLSKEMKSSKSFMGHTRFTTVGSEYENQNNHPFKSDFNNYAMAHNGTVSNVFGLEKEFKLPTVDVDTDSFVFSRMIDNTTDGTISHENLKQVAEEIRGTFNFTIIDENESIWLVKNNNPLVVIDFKDLGMIAYASTEDIMLNAIVDTYSLSDLDALFDKENMRPKGEVIRPKAGDILEIKTDGSITTSKYKPIKDYYAYPRYTYQPKSNKKSENYYNDLFEEQYGSKKKEKDTGGFPERRLKSKDIIFNGVEVEVTDKARLSAFKRLTSSPGKTKSGQVEQESVYSSFLSRMLINEMVDGVEENSEYIHLSTLSVEELINDWNFKKIYGDMMENDGLNPYTSFNSDITKEQFDEFFDEIVALFSSYYNDNFVDMIMEEYTAKNAPKRLRSISKSYLFASLLRAYIRYNGAFLPIKVDDAEFDFALDDAEKSLIDILVLSSTSIIFDEYDALMQLIGMLKLKVEGKE